MSEKKNISSGAKKAQSLTRTDENNNSRNTASVEELANQSAEAKKQSQRRAEGRHRRAEAEGKARADKKEDKRKQSEQAKQARAAKMEARTAERQKAAAEKQAIKERHRREKAEQRAEKRQKRHTPGFGGWLAAVISLGATCLVFATIVTYGWINMSAMQTGMAGMYTQSLYELNAIVDNLDSNLSKARVSTSSADRTRVLTDIAIESEMAEVILERMPLDITLTEEMSGFINKMGDSAQNMLYTVAAGGELEEWQIKSLEYMYANNLKLKRALNEVVATADGKTMLESLKGKASVLDGSFSDIQNNVIEEPKGIFDGPFSDSAEDTNMSFFEGLGEISQSEAEEIAKGLFADYKVTEARCTGEATKGKLSFYNISVATEDGEMLAQLSKKGGKLVMFDSYKECTEHNFSVDRCKDIATDFLKAAGYENVKPVWVSENETTCNINFCYVQDGVVVYPDMIKVKVCEERGLVTGAEAMTYVMNHSQRDIPAATVTEAQAQSAIDGRIDVTSSRLAIIPLNGEEILCHEFAGSFDGSDYFVYVDAQTGEEVQVLTVIGTAQGRAVL